MMISKVYLVKAQDSTLIYFSTIFKGICLGLEGPWKGLA